MREPGHRPGARWAAALGVLSVVAAACATPYRPLTLDGGYANSRLNPNTFQVVFQGNAHTTWKTAEAYALYRCAEVTVESGFDFFVVVGGNSDAALSHRGPTGYALTTSGHDGPPMVVVLFKTFKGQKPVGEVFDARDVLHALGPSIKR